MYDDDLEKTRALNELNVLNTNNKENEEVSKDTNEFEMEEKEALFNDLTREEQVITEEDSKEEKAEKKKKPSLIDKFKKLPKKNKVIIIVSAVIILLLIVGLIIFLVSNKKSTHQDELPSVVLAKDNYKYQDGILTILDDKDTTLGTYACENKDENKCYVAFKDNNEDNFNTTKNVHEDGSVVKERSQAILNRYIFIYDNDNTDSNKIKLYDMLNNKVLDEYLSVKQYDVETKNLAVLKNKDNKYGIIKFDESSQTNMIDFVYDYIGIIDKEKDNLIVVKNNKGYYLVDYTNNLKTKAFNEIIDYNDNYVIAKNSNDKYSVYDYTGEEFNKDYDYISLINDEYLAAVKDKKLYIKGYSDNKFNEEGYELTNDEYRMVYTFDDKNKLTSTSYAYTFELHDKTLTIKLQNTDKTSREEHLNLKEGEVSAKYKYYSYFNGKLYFYEDEEKTKVIGTYECKNKNENLSDDKFNNCHVANNTNFSDNYMTLHTDNNSVLPVYNNRYAFIYDASDLSNDSEIKFYDFTDNKSLGTYVQIDAPVEANVEDLTYKSVSYVSIIAKLKKNSSYKYGLIEITADTAQVNQNFKFIHDYIERASNNYIVKLENGNWQMTYEDGKYTSAEFPSKIMNSANSFVVIKEGDKVSLYNGDGSVFAAVKDSFDFIDISNKYVFAAVSNNKLRIYDYTGKKLNTDDITLISSKAFKLSATKDEATIKIYDENNKEKQVVTIKLNDNTEDNKEGE